MDLEITPLGTGHAFTKSDYETNYLIQYGETSLLVDCGPNAGKALAALGQNLFEMEHVYISHHHLDHVGGLVELGMMAYLKKLPKPKIFGHRDLLSVLWPQVLQGFLGRYVDHYGVPQQATANTFFEWQAMNLNQDLSQPFFLNDLSLRLIPVQHIPGMISHGLIIQDLVYITTDTIFQPQHLEDQANRYGLKAIFHDCSFGSHRGYVHATYEELLTLPHDLQELLILTHYEDFVQEEYNGPLALGEAGRTYCFCAPFPAS